MPFDPNTPRSRDEVLLQAIVSGDSSAMGDPRDREEEFVKAIADKETLPDYSEASEGDVLQIGTDGPEWATPSGENKYINNIYSNAPDWGFHCSIIATERLNTTKLAQYLYSIGATYISQAYPATGYTPAEYPVIGVYSSNGTELKVVYFDGSNGNNVVAPVFVFTSKEI